MEPPLKKCNSLHAQRNTFASGVWRSTAPLQPGEGAQGQSLLDLLICKFPAALTFWNVNQSVTVRKHIPAALL